MKKLLSGLLCAGMILTGCSQAPKETGITVTDQAGREVTLEKPAEKVASGYYISTSTLIGLGHADKIVGVEMKADTRLIYKEAAPEVLELPALGNKKMFNVEECAKADSDVVFLPVSLESYIEELEALDMEVVLLDPETQEDFKEAVEIIGEVMGCEDKVDEYFDYEEKLLEKYEVLENDKTVYFAGSDILSAAATGMFQNEIIEYAGAKNALDIEGSKWAEIDIETLIKANPDYIFVEAGSLKIEDFTQNENLQDIKAVKEGNVYIFPSELETWDTPCLSSALGKIWAASIINPEKVKMNKVVEESVDFYTNYYGFNATNDLLGF